MAFRHSPAESLWRSKSRKRFCISALRRMPHTALMLAKSLRPSVKKDFAPRAVEGFFVMGASHHAMGEITPDPEFASDHPHDTPSPPAGTQSRQVGSGADVLTLFLTAGGGG